MANSQNVSSPLTAQGPSIRPSDRLNIMLRMEEEPAVQHLHGMSSLPVSNSPAYLGHQVPQQDEGLFPGRSRPTSLPLRPRIDDSTPENLQCRYNACNRQFANEMNRHMHEQLRHSHATCADTDAVDLLPKFAPERLEPIKFVSNGLPQYIYPETVIAHMRASGESEDTIRGVYSSQALLDYNCQLMLLEEQNRKRSAMAHPTPQPDYESFESKAGTSIILQYQRALELHQAQKQQVLASDRAAFAPESGTNVSIFTNKIENMQSARPQNGPHPNAKHTLQGPPINIELAHYPHYPRNGPWPNNGHAFPDPHEDVEEASKHCDLHWRPEHYDHFASQQHTFPVNPLASSTEHKRQQEVQTQRQRQIQGKMQQQVPQVPHVAVPPITHQQQLAFQQQLTAQAHMQQQAYLRPIEQHQRLGYRYNPQPQDPWMSMDKQKQAQMQQMRMIRHHMLLQRSVSQPYCHQQQYHQPQSMSNGEMQPSTSKRANGTTTAPARAAPRLFPCSVNPFAPAPAVADRTTAAPTTAGAAPAKVWSLPMHQRRSQVANPPDFNMEQPASEQSASKAPNQPTVEDKTDAEMTEWSDVHEERERKCSEESEEW